MARKSQVQNVQIGEKAMTPYTTRTGVQIGINCQPRAYFENDRDMLNLQEALLKKEVSWWMLFKNWFW